MPQFRGDVGSEWCQQHHHILQHLAAVALLLSQLIDGNHEGRDRGVVAEALHILAHFLDEFVQSLEIFLRGLAVIDEQSIAVAAIEERP